MNALMQVATPIEAPANGGAADPHGDHLRIIRAEYDEMPCLALTGAQFARLWDLGAREAASVLTRLVVDGFLRCNDTGRYVRADLARH